MCRLWATKLSCPIKALCHLPVPAPQQVLPSAVNTTHSLAPAVKRETFLIMLELPILIGQGVIGDLNLALRSLAWLPL